MFQDVNQHDTYDADHGHTHGIDIEQSEAAHTIFPCSCPTVQQQGFFSIRAADIWLSPTISRRLSWYGDPRPFHDMSRWAAAAAIAGRPEQPAAVAAGRQQVLRPVRHCCRRLHALTSA